MAARRGKNQARRNGGGSKPSWLAPLAIGLAIGGLAFGYLHFKDQLKQPMSSLLPTPDPNATAKPASSEEAVADSDKPRRTYDFYKLLPEKEVVIPDAELAAQAEAEAKQAAALEAERAARDATAAKGGSEDKPNEALGLDGDSRPATPDPSTAAAAPDGSAPAAPVAPAAAASADGPHYVIQAGAFLGSNEAEALKAKIALTGQVARVEVAQINGNTVHRVRMGPYPNAASLAEAKSALAAHGIDAQAIKVK
jgi:cell division protein FtsN